jgi:transcription antitermination protein NusB
MISRRILRIKIMQALYAYHKHAGESTINTIEKDLLFSINKTYDLYHYLFILIIELSNFAEKRIEIAQNKKLPSIEDLNPNRKFLENQLIHQIRINNQLLRYVEKNKLNWVNYPELIKNLYQKLIGSKAYIEYMSSENTDYQNDKSFIIKVYKNTIASFEPLYQTLEEQSIFWNDEIEFVIGSIIKTIKKFEQEDHEDATLMPLYKSDDDLEFTKKLFRKVILNQQEYTEYIKMFSKNWDFDRIAFMDILLLEMAICESIEFVNIPVKVTINEYIELSKYYSTQKSNLFINGVLDKVVNYLKKTNKINKQGRGLIGEV